MQDKEAQAKVAQAKAAKQDAPQEAHLKEQESLLRRRAQGGPPPSATATPPQAQAQAQAEPQGAPPPEEPAEPMSDDEMRRREEARQKALKEAEKKDKEEQISHSEDIGPVEMTYADYEKLRTRNHPFTMGKAVEVAEDPKGGKAAKGGEEAEGKAKRGSETKPPEGGSKEAEIPSVDANIPASISPGTKVRVYMNLVERTALEEISKTVEGDMSKAVTILLDGPLPTPEEVRKQEEHDRKVASERKEKEEKDEEKRQEFHKTQTFFGDKPQEKEKEKELSQVGEKPKSKAFFQPGITSKDK